MYFQWREAFKDAQNGALDPNCSYAPLAQSFYDPNVPLGEFTVASADSDDVKTSKKKKKKKVKKEKKKKKDKKDRKEQSESLRCVCDYVTCACVCDCVWNYTLYLYLHRRPRVLTTENLAALAETTEKKKKKKKKKKGGGDPSNPFHR
jgi:hypothetical protein